MSSHEWLKPSSYKIGDKTDNSFWRLQQMNLVAMILKLGTHLTSRKRGPLMSRLVSKVQRLARESRSRNVLRSWRIAICLSPNGGFLSHRASPQSSSILVGSSLNPPAKMMLPPRPWKPPNDDPLLWWLESTDFQAWDLSEIPDMPAWPPFPAWDFVDLPMKKW